MKTKRDGTVVRKDPTRAEFVPLHKHEQHTQQSVIPVGASKYAPRCAGEPFQLPCLCVAAPGSRPPPSTSCQPVTYRSFIEHGVPRYFALLRLVYMLPSSILEYVFLGMFCFPEDSRQPAPVTYQDQNVMARKQDDRILLARRCVGQTDMCGTHCHGNETFLAMEPCRWNAAGMRTLRTAPALEPWPVLEALASGLARKTL